jgi:hypothetical protein
MPIINDMPSIYSRYQLSDPAKTNSSWKGAVGYLMLGAAALPFIWLTGVVGTLFMPIQCLWSAHQLKMAQNRHQAVNGKLKELQGRVQAIGNEDVAILQAQIKSVQLQLGALQGKVEDLHLQLKRHKQSLVASLLACLPGVGMLAAGMYLRGTTPDIIDTGVRGIAEALTRKLFEKSEIFQGLVYIQRGRSHIDPFYAMNSAEIKRLRRLGAKEVSIPVARAQLVDSKLQAFALPPKAHQETFDTAQHIFDPTKPTTVIFHGNGVSCESMAAHAEFYQQIGFNVLMVTMGGYPGSDARVKTSEKTSYQDANAVINYLKEQGAKDIVIHGTSLGGTMALAAAELHPDVVKLVVADQTLDKVTNTSINCMRHATNGKAPTTLIRAIMQANFPVGETVPGVFTVNGQPYKTDGLNNVRKASQVACEIFTIKAQFDSMMGRADFTEDCADDIVLAKYGKETQDKKESLSQHQLTLPNIGHCGWFSNYTTEKTPNYFPDASHQTDAYTVALPLRDKLLAQFFPEKYQQIYSFNS